jgi:hypothetical protein
VTTAVLSGPTPFDAGPIRRLQPIMNRDAAGMVRAGRRAALIVAVSWLPLVMLAAAQGVLIGPTLRESLLFDPVVYGRYVLAISIFIVAEPLCLPRLSRCAQEFLHGRLIRDADRDEYLRLLHTTRSLLQRRWIQLVLVLLAYVGTFAVVNLSEPRDVSTWAAAGGRGFQAVSLAGWWRLTVSQPLFLLAYLMWLWRIVLWWWFLWRVSRFKLRLIAAHPDHAGGLSFLSSSLRGFRPVVLAMGCAAAGTVSQAVLAFGRSPMAFKSVIGFFVAIVVVLFAGPLCLFYARLLSARSNGIFTYGALASNLGRQFEGRWLVPHELPASEILSAQDFSATIDLYSVVEHVHRTRLIPFTPKGAAPLLGYALAPFIPIFLTVLPLKDLLQYAAKFLL